MKVIDSFMFDRELDMLKLRLETMDWCDHHIIVEAEEDHHGRQKPLFFADNWGLFEQWKEKITYVSLPALYGTDTWSRLQWQQNQVVQGLQHIPYSPDDYLLVCDVDEILDAEAQLALATAPTLMGFRPRIMMYAVDWEYPGRFEGRPEPRAIRMDRMQGMTVTDVRDTWEPMTEAHMGFHFTWLGGVEAQTDKLSRIAHTEVTDIQRERITSGRAYNQGLHISGQMMQAVDVDESWPYWIRTRQCPESWFRPRGEGSR